jgi:hypothetical protein
MEKKRIFKNETKITQVYYNRARDPIELKPGETYVEDLRGVIDVNELIRRERDRRAIEMDVDEAKRVKRLLAQIRVTRSLEELEKIKSGESNQDVIDAILVREKELLLNGK